MTKLIDIITSDDDLVRNQSLESVVATMDRDQLIAAADQLDQFRRGERNLYRRVRALFFLAAIHRYHLPPRLDPTRQSEIPFDGYQHLLERRFLEAIEVFLETQADSGASDGLCSALAEAYHRLGFQTLADQVKQSVRTVRGNQWMFRLGHPADHPLRFSSDLLAASGESLPPLLCETTAVRMDFSHSAWSDIFFLGMDFPEGARVLNVSVDLGVCGRDAAPRPPIETYLRIIDQPVIRLVSVDLKASTDVTSIGEMFDFARDYLGLLKAAVIAAGIVPPGLEGCQEPLESLLARMIGPGKGFELVSKINDIPKGSRLAVSTNLLGSLISILMRATGQVRQLTGVLTESDRRLVAARAILGEWIGGSGGGWQDSGGVWPGIKLICGTTATEGDPEYGISRGRLTPVHTVLDRDKVDDVTRQKLQDSLIMVHGGMAQNVGPILEMVTEHYLLRGEKEWAGRQKAMQIYDEVVDALQRGDIRAVGDATTRNFEGPLQSIIPWATNRFTDRLIESCRQKYGDQFWGFWMLGGMSGGGMGFIFDPTVKPEAQAWLGETMIRVKREMETALPFAMDPVVYDFAINDNGTAATLRRGNEAMLPGRYYEMMLPAALRRPARELSKITLHELQNVGHGIRRSGDSASGNETDPMRLLESILPAATKSEGDHSPLRQILEQTGFDRQQHEQIRSDLRSGRLGLAQNRLGANASIEDVDASDLIDARVAIDASTVDLGRRAIADGRVGIVTLAAGVGSRWTQGAGVCKALHPFHRFAGRHRNFLEVHLAKNRAVTRQFGGSIPHVVTTSWLTERAIRDAIQRQDNYGFEGDLYVSTGRSVGLRMIPMLRDLRFMWEETAQQVLDEQQQKVRESLRAALSQWAVQQGEGSDYTDNLPAQCMHPVGHWYEVPNLIRSGTLAAMLKRQPTLQHLMLHNIDTLGANVDPGLLGLHLQSGNDLNFEVITRRLEDRGGGLARVDGRVRLVEGLAMPDEEIEFGLTYYNSMTTWIDIHRLLKWFGLSVDDLENASKVDRAVRDAASRLPTYITLKDVKKRWGHGQEDIFPVSQFEKLWGDMSALPDVSSGFFVTPMQRGRQLKSQDQLDSWNRDGTAAYINSLCDWAATVS
ncbi:UTP--glucose-1-phosphate uridylyltransferase [Crateriforma conspicua]|uniref:UTP--glucose-1-phosphate uridylyltransferase n=1 Tax=Crateriforma conspicua TaxID=2527996 RepID=UPI00118B4F5C|nr:UTP--glucose-1-phosphate uridylyltransferase [Crateriforma conspicua]QDV61595.1 UTP--glucose-1-phosphate uridylyltransferase [Crateriforma conspicua]